MTCRWRCRPHFSLWTPLDDRFAASNSKPTLPRLGHQQPLDLLLHSGQSRRSPLRSGPSCSLGVVATDPANICLNSFSGITDDCNLVSGHWNIVLLDGFQCVFIAGNQGPRMGIRHANLPPNKRPRLVLGDIFVLPCLRSLGHRVWRSGSIQNALKLELIAARNLQQRPNQS